MNYNINYYSSMVSYNYYAEVKGIIYRFHDSISQITGDDHGLHDYSNDPNGSLILMGEGEGRSVVINNKYFDDVQYIGEEYITERVPLEFRNTLEKLLSINLILKSL